MAKRKKKSKASTPLATRERPPKLEARFAETTYDLMVDRQIFDPSAQEIAEAEFGIEYDMTGDFVAVIRQRLGKIRDILHNRHDFAVHLVTEAYYDRYERKVPELVQDQRRCLPGNGRGTKPYGIRCVFKTEEPLYFLTIFSGMLRASGSFNAVLDWLRREIESKRTTAQDMQQFLGKQIRRVGVSKDYRNLYVALLPHLDELEN